MSRIRSKDTRPEKALRSALWRAGLRFRIGGKLPGRPDIWFSRAKLAVFVDGCFWHGCSVHGTRPKTNAGYWNPKIEANRARDTAVLARLDAIGWKGLRFLGARGGGRHQLGCSGDHGGMEIAPRRRLESYLEGIFAGEPDSVADAGTPMIASCRRKTIGTPTGVIRPGLAGRPNEHAHGGPFEAMPLAVY